MSRVLRPSAILWEVERRERSTKLAPVGQPISTCIVLAAGGAFGWDRGFLKVGNANGHEIFGRGVMRSEGRVTLKSQGMDI